MVSLRLSDGKTLALTPTECDLVYRRLWEMQATPGAVSAAARIRHAQKIRGDREALNARESALLLDTLKQVRATP